MDRRLSRLGVAKRIEDCWECANCGTVFADESQALRCCPPEQVTGWECFRCGELYGSGMSAVECCGATVADVPEWGELRT